MNAAKYIRYILTIATALLFFSACKDDKNESQPTDFILRVDESVSIKLPNSTSYTITTNNSAISYELSGKILTVTAIKEGKVTLTVIPQEKATTTRLPFRQTLIKWVLLSTPRPE